MMSMLTWRAQPASADKRCFVGPIRLPISIEPRLHFRVGLRNFVLAHPQWNRSKSDSLAAKSYLERWLERLTTRSSQLGEIGAAAGVSADAATTHRLAARSYANAADGRAWVKAAIYEPIDGDYLRLLAAA